MYAGRRWRYRHWLFIIFLVILALSAIGPDHPRDFVLEHTFTAALVALVIWLDRRRPLSNTTCTLLFIFMLMHVLGAHYTYSKVPYDAWSQSLFGRSITDIFGFRRNHYDRLVHLCFGLMMVYPMREVVERATPLRGMWSIAVAVSFLMMLSKIYELIEWSFAVMMDPEAAELYNGQQATSSTPTRTWRSPSPAPPSARWSSGSMTAAAPRRVRRREVRGQKSEVRSTTDHRHDALISDL